MMKRLLDWISRLLGLDDWEIHTGHVSTKRNDNSEDNR